MAFILDDDETRIQDLKDKIESLEIQTSSGSISGRNESTRNTGIQSKAAADNLYPSHPPIKDFGNVEGIISVKLSDVDSHVARMTVIGDVNLSYLFSIGSSRMAQFVLDITMDAVGGHAFVFNNNVEGDTEIDDAPNSRTILKIQTTDGGFSYQAFNILSPSGGSSIPDGTIENQHLEWDNTGLSYVPVVQSTYGSVGPFGDSAFLNFPNNTIIIAAATNPVGGNVEIKVDSSNFLDITNSANDPVVLSLRAQDATELDISSSWSQAGNIGGLGGTTTFRYPTELAFEHGATLIALFSDVDEINFFKDVDINGQALFLNSNTNAVIAAFANDIQFFTNNISRIALSDSELLMGVKINANDNDVVGIKDLDFDDALSKIRGLVDVQWFQGGHQFTSVSGELNYRVDINDVHNFFTGATKVISISDGALDVNNSNINTIKELQFDNSNTFIPVSVGIGFNVTGVMIHNVPFITNFYDFRINNESMVTIGRFSENQGQIQTSFITATDALIAEKILDFATFDNISPQNGNIWLNPSGEFQFRENGVTKALGGGGIFLDSIFRIQGSVDQTKQLAFEVDNFTTGQTRTFEFPDVNGTVFINPAQEDLDLNTFDIFNIDQLTFMSSPGSLFPLNVGFSALGGRARGRARGRDHARPPTRWTRSRTSRGLIGFSM